MVFSVIEMKSKCAQDDYSGALRLIEQAEAAGVVTSEILTHKGRILQVVDDDVPCEASDVENVFRQAIELDPEYVPALVELGYFYLNIMDDADRAIPLFERAVALQKDTITETVIGLVSCLIEVKPAGVARKYVQDLAATLLDSREIKEALEG